MHLCMSWRSSTDRSAFQYIDHQCGSKMPLLYHVHRLLSDNALGYSELLQTQQQDVGKLCATQTRQTMYRQQ